MEEEVAIINDDPKLEPLLERLRVRPHSSYGRIFAVDPADSSDDFVFHMHDGKPLYPSDCTTSNLQSFTPNDFVDFGVVGATNNLMPFQDTNQIFNFNVFVF
jgi:hypothetical protein